MNRATEPDKKLFAEHRILIDHLFEKPDGRQCNLAFYRDLARQVEVDLLKNTDLLSTTAPDNQGITGNWTSRLTYTASAIKRHVRAMIEKEASSLATKEDHICRAYARLVLDLKTIRAAMKYCAICVVSTAFQPREIAPESSVSKLTEATERCRICTRGASHAYACSSGHGPAVVW